MAGASVGAVRSAHRGERDDGEEAESAHLEGRGGDQAGRNSIQRFTILVAFIEDANERTRVRG